MAYWAECREIVHEMLYILALNFSYCSWHQQLSRVSEKVDAEEKVNRTEREQKISNLLESAKRAVELIGSMRDTYATYVSFLSCQIQNIFFHYRT